MDNCKEIQNMIDSFEHGNLSLKNEEAFTHHILNCNDCREEMEIYYIILYGLDDDNEKSIENSSYSEYLDAFDFTGLVEQKLKDNRLRHRARFEPFLRASKRPAHRSPNE